MFLLWLGIRKCHLVEFELEVIDPDVTLAL